MMEINNAYIDKLTEACLAGKSMNRQDIIGIIRLDPLSHEALYLRKKAHQVALEVTRGSAYLWGAMGIDYATCKMNCKFCTFGNAWGLVKENKYYTTEEILAQMEEYLNSNVHYIVLRTTEDYSIEELCSMAGLLRRSLPGNYELILNIGDFDGKTAQKIYDSGVDGVYHALRLREGEDTNFDPSVRKATLKAVENSPLKLISLVEPVGMEHSPEELADNFLSILDHGADISGVMARVPVKGTPLGDAYPMVSKAWIAQLTAVFRLAGGAKLPNICTHPSSHEVATSGANVFVVETGAVPREDQKVDEMWNCRTATGAATIFSQAGFKVKP